MFATATVVIAAAVIGRQVYRYITARYVDGTLTGTIVESEHAVVSGTPHVTRRGEWVYDNRTVCRPQGWGVETTSYYETTTTTMQPVIESYSITTHDARFNGETLDAKNIIAVCTPSCAIKDPGTREVSVLYVGGALTYIGYYDKIAMRFWRDTWLWPPMYILSAGCAICLVTEGYFGLIFSMLMNLSYIAHYRVRRSVYVDDTLVAM